MCLRYYCSGERKYSVYHAKIRNKCSNLNVDNISKTEACDCGKISETPQRFFFECKNILQNGQICLDIYTQIRYRWNSLIDGNDTLTDVQNEILFGIVQHFIKETKRFV